MCQSVTRINHYSCCQLSATSCTLGWRYIIGVVKADSVGVQASESVAENSCGCANEAVGYGQVCGDQHGSEYTSNTLVIPYQREA